jgi:hypothetical protein
MILVGGCATVVVGGSRRVAAFFVTGVAFSRRDSPTQLFLEDRMANLIDGEVYRQQHKEEYEQAWMAKNRGAILHHLNAASAEGSSSSSSFMEGDDDLVDLRQQRKDQRMANDDPARYCADRCLATGNCDVYEDFFHFSPAEVVQFCDECVLSSHGEEACDLPHDFYDLGTLSNNNGNGKLKP